MFDKVQVIAEKVFEIEEAALRKVRSGLSDSFGSAVQLIMQAKGRVVVCGMGKSGHIARKVFSTFVSTGTPAMFLHPAEAFHGDLGMVLPEDVFLAISNSGETEEIVKLIPFLEDNGNPLIALTGNVDSTLAKRASIHLDVSVDQEACPLELAPTASTTAALVMGDALAVCLMKECNFQPENFARFHPGGSLGKRLLGRVKEYMIPAVVCTPSVLFEEVLCLISSSKIGSIVVADSGTLLGVITDGDVRRAITSKGVESIIGMNASQLMTPGPAKVSADARCGEADALMSAKGVNGLVVQCGLEFFIYHNLNRHKI